MSASGNRENNNNLNEIKNETKNTNQIELTLSFFEENPDIAESTIIDAPWLFKEWQPDNIIRLASINNDIANALANSVIKNYPRSFITWDPENLIKLARINGRITQALRTVIYEYPESFEKWNSDNVFKLACVSVGIVIELLRNCGLRQDQLMSIQRAAYEVLNAGDNIEINNLLRLAYDFFNMENEDSSDDDEPIADEEEAKIASDSNNINSLTKNQLHQEIQNYISKFNYETSLGELIEISKLISSQLRELLKDKPKMATAVWQNEVLRKKISPEDWIALTLSNNEFRKVVEETDEFKKLVALAREQKSLDYVTEDRNFPLFDEKLMEELSGGHLVEIYNKYASYKNTKQSSMETFLQTILNNKKLANKFHAALILKQVSEELEAYALSKGKKFRSLLTGLEGLQPEFHIVGGVFFRQGQIANALFYFRKGLRLGEGPCMQSSLYFGNINDIHFCLNNLKNLEIDAEKYAELEKDLKNVLAERNVFDMCRELYEVITKAKKEKSIFSEIPAEVSNGYAKEKLAEFVEKVKDLDFVFALTLAKAIVEFRNRQPQTNATSTISPLLEKYFRESSLLFKKHLKSNFSDFYNEVNPEKNSNLVNNSNNINSTNTIENNLVSNNKQTINSVNASNIYSSGENKFQPQEVKNSVNKITDATSGQDLLDIGKITDKDLNFILQSYTTSSEQDCKLQIDSLVDDTVSSKLSGDHLLMIFEKSCSQVNMTKENRNAVTIMNLMLSNRDLADKLNAAFLLKRYGSKYYLSKSLNLFEGKADRTEYYLIAKILEEEKLKTQAELYFEAGEKLNDAMCIATLNQRRQEKLLFEICQDVYNYIGGFKNNFEEVQSLADIIIKANLQPTTRTAKALALAKLVVFLGKLNNNPSSLNENLKQSILKHKETLKEFLQKMTKETDKNILKKPTNNNKNKSFYDLTNINLSLSFRSNKEIENKLTNQAAQVHPLSPSEGKQSNPVEILRDCKRIYAHFQCSAYGNPMDDFFGETGDFFGEENRNDSATKKTLADVEKKVAKDRECRLAIAYDLAKNINQWKENRNYWDPLKFLVIMAIAPESKKPNSNLETLLYMFHKDFYLAAFEDIKKHYEGTDKFEYQFSFVNLLDKEPRYKKSFSLFKPTYADKTATLNNLFDRLNKLILTSHEVSNNDTLHLNSEIINPNNIVNNGL